MIVLKLTVKVNDINFLFCSEFFCSVMNEYDHYSSYCIDNILNLIDDWFVMIVVLELIVHGDL